MLSDYISAALASAKYKLLEDGAYFGAIKKCQGVWASSSTLEGCREDLRRALEDWLLFSLRNGYRVPVISGINLNAPGSRRTSAKVA